MTNNSLEFQKMGLKIDNAMKEQVDKLSSLFMQEGREMLKEFRDRQQNYKHEPYPVTGKNGKKLKPRKKDVDRDQAMRFAHAHAFWGGKGGAEKGTPWINRTMRAARGVYSYFERNENEIAVGLYHTMAYGAYLEFANNRQHAVILPLINTHAPVLMEKAKRLLGGAG